MGEIFMSKLFIALCRCRKIIHLSGGMVANFPFRGVFAGKRVEMLQVHVKKVDNIQAGKDYLLALDLIQQLDQHIICKLVRFKPLE